MVLVARERAALEATRVASDPRARAARRTRSPPTSATRTRCIAIAGAAAALVGADRRRWSTTRARSGRRRCRSLLDTDCEDLERVLAVNLVGPFRLTKALAGPMALARRGLVVHVSSDAAVERLPALGRVRRVEGGARSPGAHLGRRARGTGVRFLAVDPGEMDTRMHADALPDADRTTLARPADVAARSSD